MKPTKIGTQIDAHRAKNHSKFLLFFALIFGGLGQAIEVQAGMCDMLSYSVEDAGDKLRRAERESDLESAKDAARRARSSLDDASIAALDCKCTVAFAEFDSASTWARRARDADSGAEFNESLNRAIKNFNYALDSLQLCR